jgi:hypothetical protein
MSAPGIPEKGERRGKKDVKVDKNFPPRLIYILLFCVRAFAVFVPCKFIIRYEV